MAPWVFTFHQLIVVVHHDNRISLGLAIAGSIAVATDCPKRAAQARARLDAKNAYVRRWKKQTDYWKKYQSRKAQAA